MTVSILTCARLTEIHSNPPASSQAIIGQSVLVFDSVEFVWRDAQILEYDAAAQMHKLVNPAAMPYG